VTAGARHLGHYIALGVTGSLMLAVNGYMLHCAIKKRKRMPFFKKWGPFLLTFIAMFLILADLMRHVLQDTNVWPAGPWPGSNEYRNNCPKENFTCLSAVGWIFTIVCTYSGFVLLFIGTMWNANFIQKIKQIKQEWKALRS